MKPKLCHICGSILPKRFRVCCPGECYKKYHLLYDKKNRYKYRGRYQTNPKVEKPERTMCKCPRCEAEFLGSAWQDERSFCDHCRHELRGISDMTYQIGRGWASGYSERGSYYA